MQSVFCGVQFLPRAYNIFLMYLFILRFSSNDEAETNDNEGIEPQSKSVKVNY